MEKKQFCLEKSFPDAQKHRAPGGETEGQK